MIETLRDFVEMNELGIEYVVTGSYAMSAYGEIRMTKDIDVVIELSSVHVRSFFEHGGKLDCIIHKNTDFARSSFSRRYRVSVAGIEFWNTTLEDVVVSKLHWARETNSETQTRDIANLTGGSYDQDYVKRGIAQLDLNDIWAEVEKWKTLRKPHEN